MTSLRHATMNAIMRTNMQGRI